MKRRIMILGAGIYQVPLIEKAKRMGLETVVVSSKGNYPGIRLADIYLDIDTTDVNRVLKAATEYAIEGISTTGTDVCIPALGKVVDTLGIPGTGHIAACRSMDKGLMKAAFMKHDVPTAAFEIFTDCNAAQLFAEQHGYPVMVKATDSSGSRGITKVCKNNEFQFAWGRALEASRSKEIIVETFLKGIEFGVQAFVHGDRVVAVFPHRDTVTVGPFLTPIGHSMPMTLTDNKQNEIVSAIEKAVNALGIRDCISNVDLMLVDGKPMIIEIGARMGATCLPENVSIYSGADVYEHMIRLAMGEYQEFKVEAKQANAALLLRSPKAGLVTKLMVPVEVLNHPSLIDLHWDVSVGDFVREFKVGPDRIGHLIVKADTAEGAERLAEYMASLIKIEIDNLNYSTN